MATLLFAQGRRGKIGSLLLDLVFEEQHERTSQVSRYPIENGENITDHVALEPIRLTMRGFITNTPVQLLDTNTILGNDLVQTAYDQLNAIWRSKDVVRVVSGLEVYQNMILERLSIPRDRSTGQSLNFTAGFIQISKTASILETGVIPTSNLSTDERIQDIAPSNINVGMQATTPASTILTATVGAL